MSRIVRAMAKTYDYIVIGGGSGGLASGRRASKLGAKVLLVENSRLGGTCVNVGCVPKKVMFNAAMHSEFLRDHEDYCFEGSSDYKFNWTAMKQKRDAYVQKLNGRYYENLQKDKVELVRGCAKFTGPKVVSVDGEDYTAEHILVATGGHPRMNTNIPGLEYAISSDGFFELEQQPKKVVVVGAGYIAVELSGIFNALHSEVHLLIRGDRVLRKFDHMIGTMLTEEMRKAGVDVVTGSGLNKITKQGETLTVHYTTASGPNEIAGVDCVLYAVGRDPNSTGLGLELAGVKTSERGYIEVDEFQNTSAKGIYALGDVCGNFELTPVAIAAGRKLAHRIFDNQSNLKLDYFDIPSVVFSHPTIGSIGLTEEEAKQKHGEQNIKAYTGTSVPLYNAMLDPAKKVPMKVKLVALLPTEKVVGLHIIGLGADEMLQGFGVAIRMGATKKDFDNCVAIHPTSSEEVVTLL